MVLQDENENTKLGYDHGLTVNQNTVNTIKKFGSRYFAETAAYLFLVFLIFGAGILGYNITPIITFGVIGLFGFPVFKTFFYRMSYLVSGYGNPNYNLGNGFASTYKKDFKSFTWVFYVFMFVLFYSVGHFIAEATLTSFMSIQFPYEAEEYNILLQQLVNETDYDIFKKILEQINVYKSAHPEAFYYGSAVATAATMFIPFLAVTPFFYSASMKHFAGTFVVPGAEASSNFFALGNVGKNFFVKKVYKKFILANLANNLVSAFVFLGVYAGSFFIVYSTNIDTYYASIFLSTVPCLIAIFVVLVIQPFLLVYSMHFTLSLFEEAANKLDVSEKTVVMSLYLQYISNPYYQNLKPYYGFFVYDTETENEINMDDVYRKNDIYYSKSNQANGEIDEYVLYHNKEKKENKHPLYLDVDSTPVEDSSNVEDNSDSTNKDDDDFEII